MLADPRHPVSFFTTGIVNIRMHYTAGNLLIFKFLGSMNFLLVSWLDRWSKNMKHIPEFLIVGLEYLS
jgi:hypothetical protein